MDNIARNIINKFDNNSDSEIKEYCLKNSNNYDIIALNIHGDLNIGNMMRSANLCGCRKFIIFGKKKYDKRSCVGVQNYLTIDRVCGNDLVDRLEKEDYYLDDKLFYDFIIENNYLPIFIEQDTKSIIANDSNIRSIINFTKDKNKIPIFIFGNEIIGIPENILNTRDKFEDCYTLELKQKGAIVSYNVSNCFSIICYKIMELTNN